MVDFKSVLKGRNMQFRWRLKGNELLIVQGCKKILFLGPCDAKVFWGRNLKNDQIYEIEWSDIIRIIK